MEHPIQLYSILHEDEDILVADKLAPIPVQSEKSGDPCLQDLLKEDLSSRGLKPFLEAAHRIDRRASGAIVFARSPKALSTLDAAFRDRRVEKTYIACVEREPEPSEGRLEHRLVWDKRRNVVRALAIPPGTAPEGAKTQRGGERAVLDYRLSGRSERYFFVEVSLLTGRHHQLRAQFAAAGFPIRGDLKYGARRSTANGLIMLHARNLAFAQPRTGERIEMLAPFPDTEPLWQQCPQ
jgi:23S rRNA pseudouridine1911/1915/1917 synthase